MKVLRSIVTLLVVSTVSSTITARVTVTTAPAPQDLTMSYVNECTRVMSWNIPYDSEHPLRDYTEESHTIMNVPRSDGNTENFDIMCRSPKYAPSYYNWLFARVTELNEAHGRPTDQTFDCHFVLFNDLCKFTLGSAKYDYVQTSESFDIIIARNFNNTHESSPTHLFDYRAAEKPFTPSFEVVPTGDREIQLRYQLPRDDYHRHSFSIEISCVYFRDLSKHQMPSSYRTIEIDALEAMRSKQRGDAFLHVETFRDLPFNTILRFGTFFRDSKGQRSSTIYLYENVYARPQPFEFNMSLFEPDAQGAYKFNVSWDVDVVLFAFAATEVMELFSRRVGSDAWMRSQTVDLKRQVGIATVYPSETQHLELGYEYEVALVASNGYGRRNSTNTKLIKLGCNPTGVQDLAYLSTNVGNETHSNVLVVWKAPADTGTGERPIKHYIVAITRGAETTVHIQVEDTYEISDVEFSATNLTVAVVAMNALELTSEPATTDVHIVPNQRREGPVFNQVSVSAANTIDLRWTHMLLTQSYVIKVEYLDSEIETVSDEERGVSAEVSPGASLQYTLSNLAEGLLRVEIAALRFGVESTWTTTTPFYCTGKPEMPYGLKANMTGVSGLASEIEISWNYRHEEWPQMTQLTLKRVNPYTRSTEELANIINVKNATSHSESGTFDIEFDYYVRARVRNEVSSSGWTDWALVSVSEKEEEETNLKETGDTDAAAVAESESFPAYGIVLLALVPLLLLALAAVYYLHRRQKFFYPVIPDVGDGSVEVMPVRSALEQKERKVVVVGGCEIEVFD
ncbi:MAG: hypothetical protein MHM6MM_007180 [Cercozoa sp. M6MM]